MSVDKSRRLCEWIERSVWVLFVVEVCSLVLVGYGGQAWWDRFGDVEHLANQEIVEAVARQRQIYTWVLALCSVSLVGTGLSLFCARERRRQAEEALQESQRAFSTLMDNLPGMAYRCRNDRDWTMEFVSQGCLGLTGYRPNDLIQNRKVSYGQVIHPDDRESVWGGVQAALQEGTFFQLVYRIVSATGEEKWVWEQGRGVFSSAGDLLAMEGFITDVSEEKRAEEALRENEERLRLAMSAGQMEMWEWNILTNQLSWSESIEAMFGLGPGTFGGTYADYLDLIYPQDRDRVVRTINRSLEDPEAGDRYHIEHRMTVPGGEVRWLEGYGHVLRDDEGRPTRVLGTVTDATERKRAEEKLRESEQRFAAFMQHLPGAAFIHDDQERVVYANDWYFEQVGLVPREVIGRRYQDFVTPEVYEYFSAQNRQVLGEGRAIAFEDTMPAPDGSITYLTTKFPIPKAGGVFEIGSVSIDITSRKRVERLLRIQRDLGVALSATSDLAGALDRVLEATLQVEGIDGGGVYLVDPSGGGLELVTHTGLSPQFAEAVAHYDADVPEVRLVMAGKPVYRQYPDVLLSTEDSSSQQENLRALAVIPIRYEGGDGHSIIVGALNLASHTHDEIPVSTRDALEAMAAQAATAISRIRAETALRESEERFRTVVEHSADGIVIHDLEGRLIEVNQRFCRNVGCTREELLSMSVMDIDPHAAERGDRGRYWDTLVSGQVAMFEVTHRRQDGSEYPAEVNLVPIELRGQKLIVASVRDITQRRQAQERTQRLLDRQTAVNQLALALGATSDLEEIYHIIYGHVHMLMDMAVFIVSFYDSEMQLIRAGYAARSAGALDASSFPPIPLEEEGQGTQSRVIRTGEPFYVPDFRQAMGITRTEYIIQDSGEIVEAPPPVDEGEEEFTRSALFVPMKVEGETIGVMQVQSYRLDAYDEEDRELLAALANVAAIAIQNARLFEDLQRSNQELRRHREHLEELIAERTAELHARVAEVEQLNRALANLLEDLRATNRSLEETGSKLQVANQELQDFAYVVSHDLKAPLRAISQLAGWISADYADTLDEDGRELLGLLIGRTKRMHGLIEGILQYSRVGRVTEEERAVDLNQLVQETVDLLAPPEHIRVTVEGELPTVVAERTRIGQVFQNLLSNAIKFMDKPEGWVSVGCVDEGTHWQFSVADNGPGIEEKYYPKVFQMFQTLAPRDEFESTGIGMALVKKIVETWGGKIWLESTVGQGSTFYFTLPKNGEDHHLLSATGTRSPRPTPSD